MTMAYLQMEFGQEAMDEELATTVTGENDLRNLQLYNTAAKERARSADTALARKPLQLRHGAGQKSYNGDYMGVQHGSGEETKNDAKSEEEGESREKKDEIGQGEHGSGGHGSVRRAHGDRENGQSGYASNYCEYSGEEGEYESKASPQVGLMQQRWCKCTEQRAKIRPKLTRIISAGAKCASHFFKELQPVLCRSVPTESVWFNEGQPITFNMLSRGNQAR
jgi:hypothetical protein